jgi:hypothetical protein
MRTGSVLLLTAFCPVILAADSLQSGLQPGQRPGPYAAVVCTGPNRGQAHCYICEAADRPIFVIFARKMSEPLGKLVRGLDDALLKHKDAELRAWVTFLHDDQSAIDAQVVQWGKAHGIRNVPLAVFEDPDGPPAYRLNKQAEVTVLLSVKQKVVRNFSFRAGELTEEKARAVLGAIPGLLPPKK